MDIFIQNAWGQAAAPAGDAGIINLVMLSGIVCRVLHSADTPSDKKSQGA